MKFLIAGNKLRELLFSLRCLAVEKHPNVLNGRPVDAVVEVDKVGCVVAPQNIAAMTVAVQADEVFSCHGGEQLGHRNFTISCDRAVGREQVSRYHLSF